MLGRSLAKKNGDVDWEMFVRVLQSRGAITEGEAAEKLQCAWRVFAAKKMVATLRREHALAALSQTSKTKGKGSGKKTRNGKSRP